MIRGIAAGDRDAMARLYDASSPLVYGLVRRMLRDPDLAEETTLDVYLQIRRQADRFDAARGNPCAWLLTVARTRAIDRLRVESRRRTVEPLESAADLPADEPGPDIQSVHAERRLKVREAMAQLSAEQRQAITIAYFDGLSQSEIASALGQPLGTVKTRIRLGMQRLRTLLAPMEEAHVDGEAR
jgi:RNA polymerase sigma-70 factor (ECF subfamily)